MSSLRLSSLLPLILLLAGSAVTESFNLPIVPECRGEDFVNTSNIMDYETEATLESDLLALTNQHRIEQGLKPLAPDAALSRIARTHSHDMAQQGLIGHDLSSGDLGTRVQRAGYLFENVRENVGKASTVPIVQDLFLHSLKHRNNMLATDVTHVGIGIVRCNPPFDRHLYITEIFAKPRKEYQLSDVRSMTVNRLAKLQHRNGLISVQADPLLENLALRSLSSLEIPVEREDLQCLLADSADELIRKGRTDLSRLEVAVQLLRNPDNFKIPEQDGKSGADMFGTAIRQITDSRNQPAFLALTLIGFTADSLLEQKMARFEQ